MIDYFLKFTNEAAAIADASGTNFYNAVSLQWNPDRVIPNLQIWRASQDVTTQQVVSATKVNAGSGGTNGPVTLTVVGGTGTAATISGTIAGGVLTTVTGVATPGNYSVAPTNPVAVTGGGLVGATLNLTTAPVVTHTFLTGWFCVVSLNNINATLGNHAALQIALDRELAKAGQAAIIQSNVPAILQDLRFQPVFAGSRYPVGALI